MKVIVKGGVAKVTAGPTLMLSRALRVLDPKWRFNRRRNPNAQKYVSFFDEENKTFPAGLIEYVRPILRNKGIDLDVVSRLTGERVTVDPESLNNATLRDYQINAVKDCVRNLRGIVEIATGGGKSLTMAALLLKLGELGYDRAVIVVPSTHLLHQTANVISSALGSDVGKIGDGWKQTNFDIAVATADTLRQGCPSAPAWSSKYRRMMPGKPGNAKLHAFLTSRHVLIYDEAHHVASESWMRIGNTCKADIRFGFTATSNKRGTLDFVRLMSVTGPVIHRLENKKLVDRGLLARPRVFLIDAKGVFGKKVPMEESAPSAAGSRFPRPSFKSDAAMRPWADIYRDAIVDNPTYNALVMNVAKRMIQMGHPPVVFCAQTTHIRNLTKVSRKLGIKAKSLDGSDPVEHRAKVLRAFVEEGDFALVVSTIIDEGVDVPSISGAIFAGGGKSLVKYVQRVGRVLRPKADNHAVIVDFAHRNNRLTKEHAEARFAEAGEQAWETYRVTDLEEVFTTGLLRERAKPRSSVPEVRKR